MSPPLQVSPSPRLSPSPLCCHTLDDWQTLQPFLRRFGRMRPKSLLKIMAAAGAEEGVKTPEALPAPLRKVWREHRRMLARNWPEAMEFRKGRFRLFPATVALLPPPPVRPSLERVLRGMVVKLPTLAIGILIHAARQEPLYLGQINHLPWTKDFKNRGAELDLLQSLGLVRILPERRCFNGAPGRVVLTPAGERLLLGQWGRAVEPRRGEEETGRSGEMEGRMAA